MDGTIAALFLLASSWDMVANHCDTGCVAQAPAPAYSSFGLGQVIFQNQNIASEFYYRHDFGMKYGPYQPAVGVSITDQGSAWLGAGMVYTASTRNERGYLQLSLMPGVYTAGDGPDLGNTLEIRSGIELGYAAANGIRYGLSFDHRSNAELSSVNPGLETLQLRVSVPLR